VGYGAHATRIHHDIKHTSETGAVRNHAAWLRAAERDVWAVTPAWRVTVH